MADGGEHDCDSDVEIIDNEERRNSGNVNARGSSYTMGSESSNLVQKIDVVQQVMTILETTMSRAKSTFQSIQSAKASRIEELEMEIQREREEMDRDVDNFKTVTETLEGGIHKYMALENKLRTVEEMSQDDYVLLPCFNSETDQLVSLYTKERGVDWSTLSEQLQLLNMSTEKSFRANAHERYFQISRSSKQEITNNYQKTVAGPAQALNMFRGKKIIASPGKHPGPVQPPIQILSITWLKSETKTSQYVEAKYLHIIRKVLSDEYKIDGSTINISEFIQKNSNMDASKVELTIHVEANSQNATNPRNMPRRKAILYKYDDTTFIPSNPPLVDLGSPTASPIPLAVTSTVPPVLHNATTSVINSTLIINKNNRNSASPARIIWSTKPAPDTNDFLADVLLVNNNKTNKKDATSSTSFQNKSRPESELSLGHRTVNSQSQSQIPINSQSGATTTENVSPEENNDGAVKRTEQVETQPSVSRLSQSTPPQNLDVNVSVKLHEWSEMFLEEKAIEKLTETQVAIIRSFVQNGDVLYKGIANSGKTTGMTVGILNNLDVDDYATQILIVTPNNRASKLVQKLTTKEDGEYFIICRRVDEILPRKDSPRKSKNSLCQILVGNPEEMMAILSKNILDKEKIKFLIAYKAEEIFGGDKTQNNMLWHMNKILYALNATVKVIVVHKVTNSPNTVLETFCKGKLRNKIILEEKIEIEEFILNQRKPTQREKKKTNDYSSGVQCGDIMDVDNDVDPGTDFSDLIEPKSEEMESELSPRPAEDEEWRTFITSDSLPYLGIDIIEEGNENISPFAGTGITHFYANIGSGDDDIKVDLISMLDLEEDKAIIFCDSIARTEMLSTKLRQKQLWPQVLHEGIGKKEQDVILENFRQGTLCRVLICTDFIMSICLDSADVVLNFDFPKCRMDYINRAAFAVRHINRDVRSGFSTSDNSDKKGVVVSLINQEHESLREMEKSLGITIQNCED